MLDEVNDSIALLPDKFVVSANKQAQIRENSPHITVSTSTATNKQTIAQNDRSLRRHHHHQILTIWSSICHSFDT